jgi:RimJ/RimL family protein N-acetyltransferase
MSRREKAARFKLRPLSPEDERLVFDWRNDPFIVDRSTSRRRVRWSEHRKWFGAMLASDEHVVMIVMLGDAPVGQVRFDREDRGLCVISVYLLEAYTGRRLGVRAIVQGSRLIAARWPLSGIRACVRRDNVAGQSAFRKAGFSRRTLSRCPAQHIEYRLRIAASGTKASA